MSLPRNTPWLDYCIDLPRSPTLLKSVKTSGQSSDGSPLCPGSTCRFLTVNAVQFFQWAMAVRLVSSTVPIILGFVHMRKLRAWDAVLLVELRNQNAAKWGNKDAVGSTRTVVCKPWFLGLN